MPKRVEVPGVGVAEFPDDMDDDAIAAVIRGHTADPGFMAGLGKGSGVNAENLSGLKALATSDLTKTIPEAVSKIPGAVAGQSQSEFEKMFEAAGESPNTPTESGSRAARIVAHGLGGIPVLGSMVAGPTAALEAGHPMEAAGNVAGQGAMLALPTVVGKGMGALRGAETISPELAGLMPSKMPLVGRESAREWADAAADHVVRSISSLTPEQAGEGAQIGAKATEDAHRALFDQRYADIDKLAGNRIEPKTTFVEQPTGILGPDGKPQTRLVPQVQQVPTSNVQVPTQALKDWAEKPLALALSTQEHAGATPVSPHVIERLRGIMDMPETIPLNEMQTYRSQLLALTRELNPIAGMSGGVDKHLLKLTSGVMEDAMRDQSPALQGMMKAANKDYAEFANTFNDSLVAKLAQKDPSQVHKLLLQPGTSVEQIRKVRGVLNDTQMDGLRANAANDIIFSGKVGEKLDVLAHDKKLDELFTPVQQNALRQYAAVEQLASSKGVSMHGLMAAGMGGAVGSTVAGPAGAAVGAIAGTTANRALGKLILNPKWTMAFSQYADAAMAGGSQTVRAISWAQRMREIAEETLAQPMRLAPGVAGRAKGQGNGPQAQGEQEQQVQ